jgi:hypothetical protein
MYGLPIALYRIPTSMPANATNHAHSESNGPSTLFPCPTTG